MRCALALLVSALCAARAARAPGYCGARMCGHSNQHTFCQYQPGPSPQCRGYMDAPLSYEEKARILARLNRRRSEAASGRLRNFAPAGNMLKLRWVEELAREAQRWADQCRPPSTPDERDACRDLFSTTVGQCVASVVGEAPGLRVESLVDVWYMQSMLYKGNVTYYIAPMSNVSFYGDFAQMVWGRSYMVGCGRSRFMSEWNGRLRSVERLVCNIAPRGPLPSRPLWTPAVPTTVCPSRSEPDPQLTALCNYQRYLDASTDVEGAMTLEEHVLLSIVLEIEDKRILDYPGSLDELYMTKLAAVTLDSHVTVSNYNPVHKRDIIETLGLNGNVVHIDDVVLENNLNEFMNVTRIIVKIDQTTGAPKSATKTAKLIGRPKSYNVEDLNDVDGDHSNLQQEINHHDDLPVRDNSKIDRDVYLDYSFEDVSEENISSVSELTSSINAIVTDTQHLNNIINKEFLLGSTLSTENVEKLSTRTEETRVINPDEVNGSNRSSPMSDYFENVTRSINVTSDAHVRSDDDYFSDPETVRELQEALDRMEKSLGENPPPAAKVSKVRRELRNLNHQDALEVSSEETQQQMNENVVDQQQGLPEAYTNNADQDGNKSDKSPMLNMVLKYLPYLKPYQKEILGAASSTESSLGISYVLLSFGFILTFV